MNKQLIHFSTLNFLIGSTLVFAANKMPKADNTAKNIRDRNPETSITPIDQNQSFESDVEITRLIRKEIVKDKALSTYAKNVKIITINGLVTLRGPVRTAAERAQVEGHAEKIVPMNYIVNKLEIAPLENAR